MQEARTSLPFGVVLHRRSTGKTGGADAHSTVNGQRVKRMMSRLVELKGRLPISLARTRGGLILLALLIGLGLELWFRKPQREKRSALPLAQNHRISLLLALLIGLGLGVALWLRRQWLLERLALFLSRILDRLMSLAYPYPPAVAEPVRTVEVRAAPMPTSFSATPTPTKQQQRAVETAAPIPSHPQPRQQRAAQVTAPMPSRQQPRAERHPVPLERIRDVLVVCLAVLIVLILVAAFLLRPFALPHPATSVVRPTSTVPSSTPASTSTPVPGTASILAGTYTGTIYNLAADKSGNLSLAIMQSGQGQISGHLIAAPNLQESSAVGGTIDSVHHVQFTVTDAAGHPMFFFEGNVQAATNLSGTYYRCLQTQGSQCNRDSSDYGLWSAARA